MSFALVSVSALLFGFTLVVATRFMLRWREARFRYGREAALVPLHIWTIALSYDILLLGVTIQTAQAVRWWHPLVFGPALALGLYAMAAVNRAQNRRPRISS